MFLYIVLYIQTILGYSPLRPACGSCRSRSSSFFVAAGSGNLTERVPVRLLLGAGLPR